MSRNSFRGNRGGFNNRGGHGRTRDEQDGQQSKRPRLFCDYCRHPTHVIEDCRFKKRDEKLHTNNQSLAKVSEVDRDDATEEAAGLMSNFEPKTSNRYKDNDPTIKDIITIFMSLSIDDG